MPERPKRVCQDPEIRNGICYRSSEKKLREECNGLCAIRGSSKEILSDGGGRKRSKEKGLGTVYWEVHDETTPSHKGDVKNL